MDSRLAILTDYVRQKNAAAAAASKLEPKQTWSSQTYFRLQVSSVAQFVSLFCGCWTFDTGCSLSDHPISLPINPQYDDWLSSDLRRFKVHIFWEGHKKVSYLVSVKSKSKVEISQNFVAFSEYMNFNAKYKVKQTLSTPL